MAGPRSAVKGLEAKQPEPRSPNSKGFADASQTTTLEQALQSQVAVARGLERLLEEKGRELFDTLERFKLQSRLVGQQTALHLVVESPLHEAAPKLLRAVAENLEWDV